MAAELGIKSGRWQAAEGFEGDGYDCESKEGTAVKSWSEDDLLVTHIPFDTTADLPCTSLDVTGGSWEMMGLDDKRRTPKRVEEKGRQSMVKEETHSQMSELTMSVQELYLSSLEEMEESEEVMKILAKSFFATGGQDNGGGRDGEVGDAESVRNRFKGNNPPDDLSMLDKRASKVVQQRVRAFFARNNAYERALKLSRIIEDEVEESRYDNSIRPLCIALYAFLSSLCVFIPYAIFRLGPGPPSQESHYEATARLSDTSLYKAMLSKEFTSACYFALGTCAPLFVGQVLSATRDAVRQIKSVVDERTKKVDGGEHRRSSDAIARVRLVSLVGVVSTVVPFSVILALTTLYADPPVGFFIATIHFQYSAVSAAGTFFFCKYLPNVIEFRGIKHFGQCWMLFAFTLFNVALALQVYAILICSPVGRFEECYDRAVFFQVSSAAMYVAFCSALVTNIIKGKMRNRPDDPLLSPIAVAALGINILFSMQLTLDWAIVLNIEPTLNHLNLNNIQACWHIFTKSLNCIFLSNLTLYLAKLSMTRTRGALERVLEVSAKETPYEVPLHIDAHTTPNDVDESE